ncbi:uncharacterized protein LOC103992027 [Musa acuminata AAA Group]|uniref:uncharacterized protein LOC103992027 n=1 Tax=Musa acuminata AAA Group TaxID=214697 RepID=UPI0031E0F834
MATAAFRSTSGRSSIGSRGGVGAARDAGSSTRGGQPHRRSRSLSRHSSRFPPPPPEPDDFPTPRGRFVNKLRGAGFPEISLDDIADEFFRARAESDEDSEPSAARSRPLSSVSSYRMETESSRRRGRSVSRPPDRHAAPTKGVSDNVLRRRRSVSVDRHRCSNSENDVDSHSASTQVKSRIYGNGKLQEPSSHRSVKNGDCLKRSGSQKDFFYSHDSYSSHSSSLTDDEARDFCSRRCGVEKTNQAVYAPEKGENPIGDEEDFGLYEVMRKEVRHAVKEIRTELEKVMVKNEPSTIVSGDGVQPKSSEVLQAIAEIRRNYTTELEQSEKRKQDLLAELALEEERGQELSKIVKELLPSPKNSAVPERQSRSRRRNHDRTRMSKHLTEEAEKYFEDFLFNVEDTDISSFDGERSDTSSNIRDPGLHNSAAETHESVPGAAAGPVDKDGVLLPWLKWETSSGPSPCKSKAGFPVSSGNNLSAAALPKQEASTDFNSCNQIASSYGSWSPEGTESSSIVSRDRSISKFGVGNHVSMSSDGRTTRSSFYMDEYVNLKQYEDLLFERLEQRQRIESGSMILCGRLLT